MFKNLFKSLRSNLPTPAPLNPVAIEGNRRLAEAKKELKKVRDDYAAGNIMGHPEETLETIEDYETLVARLSKAKKRGWVPSQKVIEEIEFDIDMQHKYMVSKNYSATDIEDELAWRRDKLEEARQGLR